jgi:hypothetical protein
MHVHVHACIHMFGCMNHKCACHHQLFGLCGLCSLCAGRAFFRFLAQRERVCVCGSKKKAAHHSIHPNSFCFTRNRVSYSHTVSYSSDSSSSESTLTVHVWSGICIFRFRTVLVSSNSLPIHPVFFSCVSSTCSGKARVMVGGYGGTYF